MLFSHNAVVNDGKMRESIRHECILAQKHYRQTGLHVTQTEVKEWIAQIRQGKNVDAPKCHPTILEDRFDGICGS